MIARDLNPKSSEDAVALDLLINENHGHNVILKDDYIMVYEHNDQLIGCLVARPVIYIHELIIRPESQGIRRIVAEGLVGHALSKGAMLNERHAIFTVAETNAPMQSFIESLSRDVVRQPDGRIYLVPIPTAHYRGGLK